MKRMVICLTAFFLLAGSVKGVTYSGQVTDGNLGVRGVTITYTWSGVPGSVTTDDNGNWSSSGWISGFAVTFTASQSGYTFSSPKNFTTPLLNVPNVNFTRTSYGISGSVKRGGVGLEGVTVSLTGAMTASTTTAANGNYSFLRLRTGNYTITPDRADTVFSPISLAATLNPSRTDQNFSVLLPTASTIPATNIAFGKALLRGRFEGDGTLETRVWFEYGTSGGFVATTPQQTFPPGANPTTVAATTENLTAPTIHNFRLVAANSNGTNVGQTLQFTMPYPEAATALLFDGIDDYVNAGSSAALLITNATTWETWIYPTRPPAASTKRDVILGREGEYLLARGGDGLIYYALRIGTSFSYRSTGVTVPNNQWTHVAFTYNGITPRFYLNGVPVALPDLPGTIGDANTSQNDFRIGGRQAAAEYFQGQIDEVRIWKSVRSDTEIADYFDRRVVGNEPGLAGYFRFNEGSGLTTADSSRSSLTGTLFNGPVSGNGPLFIESGALVRDPIVETLPASPVLATRATFQARINPAQAPTAVRFEFGETIAYGHPISGQDIPSGLESVIVSAATPNLQPGTTYHYRAIAENSAGVVYGGDQTFTTLVLGSGWPTSTKVTGGFSASPRHVVDAQGNVYVAGQFSGSATFNITMNSSNGIPNVFVGKLARGASWIWNNRVTPGPASAITVNAVAIDEAKNMYIAGQFTGSAAFGSTVLNSANNDAFVAKLNAAGDTWLWARSAGGTQADSANAIAVTPAGSVFITGHFSGTATFGTQNLASTGASQDIFVARLDTNGSWLWARAAGGAGSNDSGQAIVVNGAEDAFITGRFQGQADFGAFALASSAASDTDLFVAQIGKDGLWLLARRAGSSSDDTGTGLAIDTGGEVYLLGQFGGTADWDETTINLNEGGATNLFVAKLSSSATLLWYAQAGAGSASSIAVDNENRVYITGDFNISTKFGNPVTLNLVSSGNSDVFLAQLNESGEWTWAKNIGSSGSEIRGSVAVDGQGGVTLSGSYQNSISLGYVLLSTPNARDIFIARFDPAGVVEHNIYVIGEPIPIPLEAQDPNGGAIGQPSITILENNGEDSAGLESFVWGAAERKLYPVRLVTAILKWPLTNGSTNTAAVATAVGRCVWPEHPQIHVAKAPVDLEPAIPGFPYRYFHISFTTVPGASVDASSKQFSATQPGWSVVQFLNTGGELPNPANHPSKFEVVKTVAWDDREFLIDNQPATIGTALTRNVHDDSTGRNGFVYFENAFYDGAGEDRAYDRTTRTGPIIPVNEDTGSPNDDLVVVWYRTNLVTGIAWPSVPVRYFAQWPANADELIIAKGNGSGRLNAATYGDKRVYNQPDPALPGYNPNEEHAALYADTLYALRDDLNAIVGVSKPYTLLKYRDSITKDWLFKIYKVVAADSSSQFTYEGQAGDLLQLPPPLSLLPLCGDNNTAISGRSFQDYMGRLYAPSAGVIVTRLWYPLQPGFFYDLDKDGRQDQEVGACIPWLDRRPGGEKGVPIDVTYSVTWPQTTPTLQIGETLFNAKFGLPDLRHFANAKVVYDDGDSAGDNSVNSIARMFDPLAPRIVQLRPTGSSDFITAPGYSVFRVSNTDSLFAGILTVNSAGLLEFSDLPYTLRTRLCYDPLNKNLIFGGFLDESQAAGGPDDPLLLPNVLSQRERARIQALKNDTTFADVIESLYRLTRNPNGLDLDNNGEADDALLVGLIKDADGEIVPETLGDVPKILTAGDARQSGYITIAENNDPNLGGLPVTLHVVRIQDGPFRGAIKVIQSDNVFDEKLTLRDSADFGGKPDNFSFEWYYKPVGDGVSSSEFPIVAADGSISDLRGWIRFMGSPPGAEGLNEITLGDGDTSNLLILSDNYFICRFRGYVINGQTPWSDWVGVGDGTSAQLAEGWVKRVRNGLNPFETRSAAFHENETVTFASMIQQAGRRYEEDVAVDSAGGDLNGIGLIEAYETVLRKARRLSIDGSPAVNYQPANDALLLAAGYVADLYMLLGNEAFADAADPTIGFRTDAAGYGTLAPSIFTFQNQLDSLLEEELCLLRGRDTSSATVRSAPVYNRLFWNFTKDEGEVAYAQAYNITDQNNDGIINADDAAIMYPQGHGDAWGYYLSATTTYYSLFRNDRFDWIPRTEPIQLAGTTVNVDYRDERKFARAAAAKAKTGAEIVDLTYRSSYVDDPAGQYQGYKDTDAERAWGVSEWAHRAGSGALFDWVAANALLPAADPNTQHVGIEKIDRTTVPELAEIVAGYETVQSQVDKADGGLNPLGLAKNVVPFDIDPVEISSGKTHFEQIYQRAIDAVNNTSVVFNHANQLSQALRALQDSVNNFSRNAQNQERDYKNRMIEAFGYPYAGDIGPGKTYPAGYDGPDIYHYMYVNTLELNGDNAPPSETFTAFFKPHLGLNITNGKGDFFFPEDAPGDPGDRFGDGILKVTYPRGPADYGFFAPSEWGQRRAPGEIQMALADLVQTQARFKQALLNYDNLLFQISDATNVLQARYNLQADKVSIHEKQQNRIIALSVAVLAANALSASLETAKEIADDGVESATEVLPKSVGTSSDVFFPVRGALRFANAFSKAGLTWGKEVADNVAEGAENAKERVKDLAEWDIQTAEFEYEIQQKLGEIQQLLRQEAVLRIEAFNQRETLIQSADKYQAALAKGLRLADERIAFRKNAAADTQASRYQDMSFRIFRNDAIQKYRAQFDLASQYVFLAAVAYDYETQLLGGHTGSGREFLTDIIRQRSLGQVENGIPVAGRHGLADPLARLSQNFTVLKGQLGFNNPQTETGRFSLRNELLRISASETSGNLWRDQLKKSIVPDLWAIPEFRRYCRPFAPESAGPQPGLVIRFPTTVTFGLNFFAWPLGGGDNSYDPTLFATKVRSAGVWFENYTSNGLSQTPRVYLIPVGADIMRSPSGNDLETREWRVVDQKIPVPFPIGFSSLTSPTWIPMNDSLSDTFAGIRRFSSFRAYHDKGTFDASETISDSRLIGRSVWNTDWMLIIPGGTFLADPNEGLDTFVNLVSDIKIFFQTYSYSGN